MKILIIEDGRRQQHGKQTVTSGDTETDFAQIGLSNGLDLKFDSNGKFAGIDD
jgi:hypothetical protein